MKLNRAERRKVGNKVVNEIIKGREQAVAKKQYGIGMVITNLMLVITFWSWSWILWDRRVS